MSPDEELFTQVARRFSRCVWLDGGGAREWSGRCSLVGWLDDDDVSLTYHAGRREVVRHRAGRTEVIGDDIWQALTQQIGAGEQWFGYLGYACRPDLPATASADVPDAVWLRPSRVRAFPAEVRRDVAAALPAGEECPVAPAYASAFARIQEALHAGDTYEANLTYRLAIDAPADPVDTYLRLRSTSPAPYAGYLQHDVPGHGAWLLSSSPERFARIGEDRVIETRPIKGTMPRGATAAADEAGAEHLRTDPKLRAENLMITDLLRNDLAIVCDPGTVEVPDLMRVESYPSVHQLVTTVSGRLRADVGAVDAVRAIFPAGSMTGAPKLRTMELIAEVERDLGAPRGAYAGAFGRLTTTTADLGVVIRSLTTPDTTRWSIGTGGGITVRSDLAEEWAETRWKAARLIAAVAGHT